MANIVALLDSMWGWGGYYNAGEEAPRSFRINPENHSGSRLYRLCGNHFLLVTNCCRFVQYSAKDHGKPDAEWVRENLIFLRKEKMDLLLLCGRVAQETFRQICQVPKLHEVGTMLITPEEPLPFTYFCIDHPAARRWSKSKMDSTAQEIERLCRA